MLGILVIIGSHVIVFEFDGHVLGSARLKLLGLLEANQVALAFSMPPSVYGGL